MAADQDIKKVIKRLNKIREDMQGDMLDVGEAAVELIKKRTRLGFGVAEKGGRKKRLDKLSEGYKKSRKRHKPTGPTTASKSNLTRSGGMLDDLEAKEKSDGKIHIDFSSADSQDKAGWVSDDRPFNNLSKAEIKQLEQQLDKAAKKASSK